MPELAVWPETSIFAGVAVGLRIINASGSPTPIMSSPEAMVVNVSRRTNVSLRIAVASDSSQSRADTANIVTAIASVLRW